MSSIKTVIEGLYTQLNTDIRKLIFFIRFVMDLCMISLVLYQSSLKLKAYLELFVVKTLIKKLDQSEKNRKGIELIL